MLIAPVVFGARASAQDAALEDIYVLRSIREQQSPVTGWCAPSRTGFEPFAKDAERFFSFWSVRSQPENGKIIDAHDWRVAELRGCFQRFYDMFSHAHEWQRPSSLQDIAQCESPAIVPTLRVIDPQDA